MGGIRDLLANREEMLMTSQRKTTRSKASSAVNSETQERKTREQYEKVIQDWDRKLKPQTDAIRSSKCLSKEDMSVRINATN